MKKCFKFLKLALGLLAISLFAGCETGLGSALDLEAPEITVTSPVTLSNVHKLVTITGTCKDNVGVVRIDVQDKQTGQIYQGSTVTGNTWTTTIELEEGEKTLLCIARDAAGNQSAKSSKTIIYLVDETAPVGLSWYVDRGNNVQTPLMELETLQAMDYDDFTNIDVPQNEKFSIYGRFYDAMSINTITLTLYEDERKVAEKTVTATTIDPGSSIYSPCFEFKASDLSGCSSGQHFLRLEYTSKDDHGNESTRVLPYMIWWPESDQPRIQLSDVKNGTMRVNIGSAIPVHFFDDDLLSEVKATLHTGTVDVNAIKSNPSSITWEYTQSGIAAQSKRDLPVQVHAPNLPCQRQLVTYAKDTSGNVAVKVCPVEVTDASKPLLFIETPEENTIPNIEAGTASTIKIAGYALDTSGCRELKIAYVPGKTGYQAEERGKALIKGSVTAENGEFVKTLTLGAQTNDNGWQKQVFEFKYDLLNDFKNGDVSYASEDKFFEMCLIDLDNNQVWKQLVLLGDRTAPKIAITSPATDMSVYDYVMGEENFEIKFSAAKTSGLGVDENKYKATVVWNDANIDEYSKAKSNLTVTDGVATVKIPKSEIASKKDINLQPKIEFEAYDVLGNKGVERRNVVLSPLPQLKQILSGNMNGTFKKGDVINFQAVFSDAVKVAGTPKLVLQYSADDANPKYADYTGTGNRTDTLVFTFEVPEGAECDKLIVDNVNPIVVKEGDAITEISIKTASKGEGPAYLTTLTKANTLPGKEFKLDGKLPEIESITVTPEDDKIKANADGNYYLKANETIKAVVKFTEKVNINGNPVLHMYGGAAGTTKVDFKLQSIDKETITFTHKIVKGTTPEGILKYDFAKAFTKATTGSNAGYVTEITDEAGNPLKLVKATNGNKNLIIDTTAPSAITLNIAGGESKKYNAAQTLTLTGESGATIEYSHNGGISWWIYDNAVTFNATGFTAKKKDSSGALVPENVTVSGGEYRVMTRQTDKAGNMSPESAESHFTINNTFPSVTSLVIAKADGKYAAGEKVKFTLTYADKLKAPADASIVIGFNIGTGAAALARTVKVKPVTQAAGSDKFEFEYEVTNEDEGTGVSVTSITYDAAAAKKPVDLYGNSPASNNIAVTYTGAYAAANRTGIVLDGKPPVISTYSPALNAVVTNGNVVTLTFSENVEKESGLITLRRKSTAAEPWRIPPVLTEEEFNSVYNELDDTDKEVLIKMDGGAPRMFEKNGQPLGPYKRITHGLVGGDGSSTVPDTSTKFVLDFNIGIKNGSGYLADGTEVNVSDLRAAFEKAGYHKQEVEVTDASVVIDSANKKQVKITFPKTLVDGREWELFIAPGAFRDETGNLFAGLGYTVSGETATMDANSTYSFWSNKVAKPWIRVDRYSHGYAAIEPTVTGSGTTATYSGVKIITSYGTSKDSKRPNGANTVPSGYARVRIDCETPGSTINYGWNGKVTGTSVANSTQSHLWSSTTSLTDYDPTGIQTAKLYNGYFVVGDGELLTARRDFVKAQAIKTGFTSSDYGYEGVFKTLVTSYVDGNCKNAWNGKVTAKFLEIQGGSGAGGMPAYGGFPVRDAEENKGHDKCAYTNVKDSQYVWQTYEIVSTWWILPYNGNYTSSYYYAGYGYNNHIYNPLFYSESANPTDLDNTYTEVTTAKVK